MGFFLNRACSASRAVRLPRGLILAGLAIGLVVQACGQSPEAFHLSGDGAIPPEGSGGDEGSTGGVVGTGGTIVGSGGRGSGGAAVGGKPGSGGTAAGGRGGRGGTPGSGGLAVGGTPGTGGQGNRGGSGVGGQVTSTGGNIGGGGRVTSSGGVGFGGRPGSGGSIGFGGSSTGGRGGGAGGRTGVGGTTGAGGGNCVTKIQQGGYAYGTAPACSACKDNSTSLQTKCEAVIDCLASKYPCTSNCQTECYNAAGASGPVMTCVDALMMAAACK